MNHRFRISFPLQMAIATFLGIFVGLFLGERCATLTWVSKSYVMILKITAIPYLIVAIIHGIGLLNRATAMQILKKGSLFISLVLLINIGIIYLMKWSLPSYNGPHQGGYILKEVPQLNFANLLIPENIFYSLTNNIIPSVVVFSLLIGISLMHLANKQIILNSLEVLLESLTRVTKWISRIAPIGTFFIMANQAGTVQFSTIKQMSSYIILYVIGTCIIIFWISPRLASMLSPMKAIKWIKYFIPVIVLAYTTNLVIVCLPYIINIIQRRIKMLYPKDENIQGQVQGTVSIIFNLPLGSIFITSFVFFIATLYAKPLAWGSQVELFITSFLTGLGAVGLGSWINSLSFILDVLGLPVDGINLYLTAIPFTAGFQSMVSVMIISTLAFLITLSGRGLLSIQWKSLFLKGSLTILPVFLLFGAIKKFDLLPEIRVDKKTIYDLEIESDVSVRFFSKDETTTPSSDGNTLDRILGTKKLRIGYDPNTAPFCFFNKQQKLVGFDVAYAYQLAFDLSCKQIEFIPITYGKLGEQLSNNYFDLAMSAISISEERLKKMCFPHPLLEAKIVFVTKDQHRKKVVTLDHVKENKKFKIAVLINTAYEGIAYEEFPSHEIVLLESHEEFDQDKPPADILIWEEQEAIAWTVAHPEFHVVYPKPTLGKKTLGYPVKMGDPEFLCYINSWLTLKKNEGFQQQMYDLWILSKTRAAESPKPRWSILDNVILKKK